MGTWSLLLYVEDVLEALAAREAPSLAPTPWRMEALPITGVENNHGIHTVASGRLREFRYGSGTACAWCSENTGEGYAW